MTAIDRVREALETYGSTVRGSGNQLSAQCPAHDDRDPSLSAGYRDGKVLLTCHTGCPVEDIVDSLGLTMADLFDDTDRPGCDHKGFPGTGASTFDLIASYDYTDQAGEVLYTQQRFRCRVCAEKTFRPRDAATGRLGLPDARVLYNLPAVLDQAATGGTVYVVEGEKDADRLNAMGLVATTAVNGAGKPWKHDYTTALKGARVVVIADNDAPGIEHARAVAQALDGAAESVRVLRSPLERKGADVSDHLNAGRELTDLVPLGAGAPSEKASQKSQISGRERDETNSGISGTSDEWGFFEDAPIPVDAPPLPAFPADNLGPLAEWVRAAAVSLHVPEDLAAFAALSAISAAIGGRRRVEVMDDWSEMVCLYTLGLAPSSARKTPVQNLAKKPVEEAAADLRAKVEDQIFVHNERVEIAQARYDKAKEAVKQGKGERADLETARDELRGLGDERHLPQVLAGGDSTMEYLAKAMGEQGGRIAVLTSEATLFQHAAGIYSNGRANIGPLLEGYTGGSYDLGRVSRGATHMPHTAATLGLLIQPGMAEGLSRKNPNFKEAGFLGRFLMALAPEMPPGKFRRPQVPPAVKQDYSARIRGLIDQVWASENIATLYLTQGAEYRFEAFYEDVERRKANGGDLCDLGEWAGKLCGQLIRLAACLAVYENPGATEITEDAMTRALGFAPYFIAHARRIFELMDARTEGGRKPLVDILAWLGQNTKAARPVSARQVWQGLKGRAWAVDAETVKDALEELEDLGWVAEILPEKVPGKRGRKPSPKYVVHPAAYTDGTHGKTSQKSHNPAPSIRAAAPTPPETNSGISGTRNEGGRAVGNPAGETTKASAKPRCEGCGAVHTRAAGSALCYECRSKRDAA
ncbi:DUF3987 domain-containing protein [Nocardiopsis sp. CNT-189]|uniref:DUF3987 domain-containing protein n=1 Tax=Nocardiopsis oceanisediminis TaxID=2816862 RepID=UPI003B3161AD